MLRHGFVIIMVATDGILMKWTLEEGEDRYPPIWAIIIIYYVYDICVVVQLLIVNIVIAYINCNGS